MELNKGVDTKMTAVSAPVFEVAKVRFRDLLIRIFSDSLDSNRRQFFFEPLVLLDPKSIVSKSQGSLKLNFIQITIQMWNEEVRSKVLERLRSLPTLQSVQIEEEDVCVMPFEEVQLVCRKAGGISPSIRLLDEPTSYLRYNQKLDFYLLCDGSDAPSSASVLANDFRQAPEFTLKGWQLKLECRGLSVKTGTVPAGSKPPTFLFNISVYPSECYYLFHVIYYSISLSILFSVLESA